MSYLLVVDDDRDGREALCRFLQNKGHEVLSAANGKEALRRIIERLPDAAIIDLFMPEMAGDGLIEVIRSYQRLHALPIIVLTGLPDSLIVGRARNLKVNSVLIKGKATFDEILAAVTKELGQQSRLGHHV